MDDDLAAAADQLYEAFEATTPDDGGSLMWWCDQCQRQMNFCQDSFMYTCELCNKMVPIQGDAPAAGMSAPDTTKNVRVSRTTGRIYIDGQRTTVGDRVREDFVQINNRLGGRINPRILEEAIKMTIMVRGKTVSRKETRWSIPASCLRHVCRTNSVEISDKEIVAACGIHNSTLFAGQKRINEARTAGHLTEMGEVAAGDDEAARLISMMFRRLGIVNNHWQKAALRLVELDRTSQNARTIASRCAGAIWYIVKAQRLAISEEKMQQASGVSVPTMTEVCRQIAAAKDAATARSAASRASSPVLGAATLPAIVPPKAV